MSIIEQVSVIQGCLLKGVCCSVSAKRGPPVHVRVYTCYMLCTCKYWLCNHGSIHVHVSAGAE